MKTCKKCKIEKNETEFHPCKKSKSGYQARCKICLNLARKESKNKNREEYLKKAREYAKREYDKNPIKFIERHKEWKKNNPEILSESNKKSSKKAYIKFKDQRLEYGKIYRKIYAEEKKIKDSEWRLKNPEKIKEYARKAAKNQRINSPHKVKARLLVSYAVEIGLLIKPKICSNCLKECKPEGHHADYSKPLEVVWLCKECHTKEHRK